MITEAIDLDSFHHFAKVGLGTAALMQAVCNEISRFPLVQMRGISYLPPNTISGRNAETIQFGASTISLTLRSTATLHRI